MSVAQRRYYTSSEDFSKAVTEKIKEIAPERNVLSLYDIEMAVVLNTPGVRLYMYRGEQLFGTRIDEFGFYFLEDPEQTFKPIQ